MRNHSVQFRVHPDVKLPASFPILAGRIVNEINDKFLLTNRRFTLDQAPLVISDDFGFPGSHDFPTEDFPFIIAIEHGTFLGNGWPQVTTGGVGVVRMQANEIKAPDIRDPESMHQWMTLLHVIMHEIGHNFGLAIGEYYKLAFVDDPTGVEPLAPVNCMDPHDIYWGTRQAMLRSIMMNAVPDEEWCEFDRSIIDGPYRISKHLPPLPDLAACRVQVINENSGVPLEEARVRIWDVNIDRPECELILDDKTNVDGYVKFKFADLPEHTSSRQARLVKVHRDGYLATAGWIMVWDLHEQALAGETEFLAKVMLRRTPAPPRIVLSMPVAGRLVINGANGLWIEVMCMLGGLEWVDRRLRCADVGPTEVQVRPGIYRVRTCAAPASAVTALQRRVRHQGTLCRACSGEMI